MLQIWVHGSLSGRGARGRGIPSGPSVQPRIPSVPESGVPIVMRHRLPFAGAALFAVLSPLASHAQLAEVGPVDPNNGFPAWYKDANALSLDLCLTDPALCLLDAPCTLSNPGQPFPQNYGGSFPEEAFWQRVDGAMPTSGTGQALLVMALEAAFANGPVAAGDQVTFARVRVRVDNLVAGANYTVTTPVGIFNFIA